MLFKTARIIVIILLLIAVGNRPYDYYTLLRLIVCVISIYCLYVSYRHKLESWVWIFAIIAVLFNPLFPIYLDKTIWIVIDFLVVAIYGISFWATKKLTWRRSIIGLGLMSIIIVATLWFNILYELYANYPTSPYFLRVTKYEEIIEQTNNLYRPWLIGTISITLLFALTTYNWRRKESLPLNKNKNSSNTILNQKQTFTDLPIPWNEGTYTGQVKNKIPSGHGRWVHSSQMKEYIGNWEVGKFHGEGIYIEPKGKYNGNFDNGIKQGYGSYSHCNGNKFIGQWKNNYPHGQGTLVRNNGEVINGRWELGKYLG